MNLKFSHDLLFIPYLISHGLTLPNILGWPEDHFKTCFDSQHKFGIMYLERIFFVNILKYQCTLHALYYTIFIIKSTMIIKINENYLKCISVVDIYCQLYESETLFCIS